MDVDEVKIKQEDDLVLESKVVIKRQYIKDEVKQEPDEKVGSILTETSRSQRMKRRRVV